MFLYMKIADDLKHRIESCYYRPGEALPPERELARTHQAGGKSVHVSLAMYGDFSLFRAGFSEWFQELFRLLPFLVKIHIFYRAITGNELTGLARRHPGIPIVQINSCYASGRPPAADGGGVSGPPTLRYFSCFPMKEIAFPPRRRYTIRS